MKYFIIAYFLMLIISCKKNINYDNTANEGKISLPAYSEKGLGTFGFLMDDSVWTIFGAHFEQGGFFPGQWVKNTVVSGYNNNYQQSGKTLLSIGGQLSIVQQNIAKKEYDVMLNFLVDSILPLKNYLLSGEFGYPPNSFSLQEEIKENGITGISYAAKDFNPLILQLIKYDTINKICSGRFSGTIYDALSSGRNSDSIIITEGRFDVKYH